MARTVSVKYNLSVYVTVDLDAEDDDEFDESEAIVKVFEDIENIRLADDPIVSSYDDNAVDPSSLTPDERDKAIEIAEHSIWPDWES